MSYDLMLIICLVIGFFYGLYHGLFKELVNFILLTICFVLLLVFKDIFVNAFSKIIDLSFIYNLLSKVLDIEEVYFNYIVYAFIPVLIIYIVSLIVLKIFVLKDRSYKSDRKKGILQTKKNFLGGIIGIFTGFEFAFVLLIVMFGIYPLNLDSSFTFKVVDIISALKDFLV